MSRSFFFYKNFLSVQRHVCTKAMFEVLGKKKQKFLVQHGIHFLLSKTQLSLCFVLLSQLSMVLLFCEKPVRLRVIHYFLLFNLLESVKLYQWHRKIEITEIKWSIQTVTELPNSKSFDNTDLTKFRAWCFPPPEWIVQELELMNSTS